MRLLVPGVSYPEGLGERLGSVTSVSSSLVDSVCREVRAEVCSASPAPGMLLWHSDLWPETLPQHLPAELQLGSVSSVLFCCFRASCSSEIQCTSSTVIIADLFGMQRGKKSVLNSCFLFVIA